MSIKKLKLWGRDHNKVQMVKKDLADLNIEITIEDHLDHAVRNSQLIITTTSAKQAIIQSDWVMPGTHITAVGSDTPEKCELDFNILAKAEVIIADSIEQNLIRGEIHQAYKHNAIDASELIEIGEIFNQTKNGRTSSEQITIADLTGVAIQDLVIAEAVFDAHNKN